MEETLTQSQPGHLDEDELPLYQIERLLNRRTTPAGTKQHLVN